MTLTAEKTLELTINRESLLKPLHLIASVIDKKQALPILSHILFDIQGDQLTLTGTDLEIELIQKVPLFAEDQSAKLVVPAKKLYDICRALPGEAELRLVQQASQLVIRSGRSRFTLSLISARDFPSVEKTDVPLFSFSVQPAVLKRLFEKTYFSMAHQDVRYFLNGLLLDLQGSVCTAVTTDGHRLSLSAVNTELNLPQRSQVLIPRKAVVELLKLLDAEASELIKLDVAENYISVSSEEFTFTSKLIDGKFPEYRALVPSNAANIAKIARDDLKDALSRVAILSNEKYRGAWLSFEHGKLLLQANNPDRDEAEEEVSLEYHGNPVRLGCNINYLLDVLAAIDADFVNLCLGDANSSMLISSDQYPDDQYVVMPMCL